MLKSPPAAIVIHIELFPQISIVTLVPTMFMLFPCIYYCFVIRVGFKWEVFDSLEMLQGMYHRVCFASLHCLYFPWQCP